MDTACQYSCGPRTLALSNVEGPGPRLELGICGAGAAIANAVYNACGVRVRDYPITPDKILRGLMQENIAQQR